MLLRLKQFMRRHLLLCAAAWLVAALIFVVDAYRHYAQGRSFQALCLDLPFVVLALFAAVGSVLEWKSRPDR
jgi:type II secretory pathway component PulF